MMQTFQPLGNRAPLLGLSCGLNPMGLLLHRSLMSRYVLRPLTTLSRFPLASRLSLMRLSRLALDAPFYESLNLTEWSEEPNEPAPQIYVEPRLDRIRSDEELVTLQSWNDSIVEVDEQDDTHQAIVPEFLASSDATLLEATIATEQEFEKTVDSIEVPLKNQTSRTRKPRKAKSSETKKTSTPTKKKTLTQTKKKSKKAAPAQSSQTELSQELERTILRKSEDATERIDDSKDFAAATESIELEHQEQFRSEETTEPLDLELEQDLIPGSVINQEENFVDREIEATQENFVDRTIEAIQRQASNPPPLESGSSDESAAIPVQPTRIVPELSEEICAFPETSIEQTSPQHQSDSTPHEIVSPSQNLEATIESLIIPNQDLSIQPETVQPRLEPGMQAELETSAEQTSDVNETAIAASNHTPQIEPTHFEHSENNEVDLIAVKDITPSNLIVNVDRVIDQTQETTLPIEHLSAPPTMIQPTLAPQEESQNSYPFLQQETATDSAKENNLNFSNLQEANSSEVEENTLQFSDVQEINLSETSELSNQEIKQIAIDQSLLIEPIMADTSTEELDSSAEFFSDIDVPIQGYAIGGIVTETSTPSNIDPSDTVPAMLTPGEFVMRATAAQKHLPLLRHLNQGKELSDAIPEAVDPPIQHLVQRKISKAASNPLIQSSSIQSGAFEDFEPVNSESTASTYTSPTFVFRSPAPSRSSPSNTDQWNSIEELLTFDASVTSSAPVIQRRSIQSFAEGGEVISPPEQSSFSETSRSEIDSFDESAPSVAAIDTLAQEIYQRLRQRLEIERERCGLYSGRSPWSF